MAQMPILGSFLTRLRPIGCGYGYKLHGAASDRFRNHVAVTPGASDSGKVVTDGRIFQAVRDVNRLRSLSALAVHERYTCDLRRL